jgi:hypothetical protein
MFVSVGTEDERTSPLASTRQAKKVACEKPKPEYVTPNDESVPLLDKKEEGSGEATGAGEATARGEKFHHGQMEDVRPPHQNPRSQSESQRF